MCLDYLTTEDPIIATEDIVAYKVALVVKGKPFAPFQGIKYTINERMHAELSVRWRSVHEGYHSLATLEDAVDFNDYSIGRVYQCIIPKGTQYYEGKFGDYVSYAAETIIMKPLTLSQKVKSFILKVKKNSERIKLSF